jgi:transcriptional regulator with XRE-family HTH domain
MDAMMVGERIREARHSQQLSLAQVAVKAGISTATLSRIETSKQTVELGLFLALAKILNRAPHELLGDDNGETPLADKIASLDGTDRARLWRDVSAARRTERSSKRRSDMVTMAQHVEELIAQVEFLRDELDTVRKRLRKGRG